MEDEIITATPAPDVAIILGKATHVRVLGQSTILRNASHKFAALLDTIPVIDQKISCDTKDLPSVTLPGDFQVDIAATMLRYLHHDHYESEMPDCETIMDIAMLADEFEVLSSLGSYLESLIQARIFTSESSAHLCFLLLAASTIQASNAFKSVSAKLLRVGPATSFHKQFFECFKVRAFEPRMSTMLDEKRAQINSKLVERLSPALNSTHRCNCTDVSGRLEYIQAELEDCMDTNDTRTPQERLEQLEEAHAELVNMEKSSYYVRTQGTCIGCVLRHARVCMGHAIQDIRNICYEGLSLADV